MYSTSTFSASLSASVQHSVSIPTFLTYLITRLVTIMTKNNTAKVWYSHDRMTITARSGDCIHGGQQLQKHKSDNKQGLVTKVCCSSKWILEGEDHELQQSVSCPEGKESIQRSILPDVKQYSCSLKENWSHRRSGTR